MSEEITKLSIIVDEELAEAQLTRSFHRYFAAVGEEDPKKASGMLNDLIGELIDIRESIFDDKIKANPYVEPALNTSFGRMTLSDAEQVMKERYEAGADMLKEEPSIKRRQETF